MIRITIELMSAVDGRRETLGVMDICNTGRTCDPKRGDYTGRIYRKGTDPADRFVQRRGSVKDYPRQSYVVWRLILKMLLDMFPEEKNPERKQKQQKPAGTEGESRPAGGICE